MLRVSQQQLPTLNPAGMQDRSRVALCVFMFAVLAFNPMGIFLDLANGGMTDVTTSSASSSSASSDYVQPHTGGRMLFGSGGGGVDDSGIGDATASGWLRGFRWTNETFMLWVFNTLVVILCLTKLLIYGEPITNAKSESKVHYWRHRSVDIAVNVVDIEIHYCISWRGHGTNRSTDIYSN